MNPNRGGGGKTSSPCVIEAELKKIGSTEGKSVSCLQEYSEPVLSKLVLHSETNHCQAKAEISRGNGEESLNLSQLQNSSQAKEHLGDKFCHYFSSLRANVVSAAIQTFKGKYNDCPLTLIHSPAGRGENPNASLEKADCELRARTPFEFTKCQVKWRGDAHGGEEPAEQFVDPLNASNQAGGGAKRRRDLINQKFAFTLAEVLITLGIIGVVAALTIPNVTSHYRKKVVETRLAKFYSSINQAIRRSEVDNGPVKYWDSLTATEITDENDEATGMYTTNTLEWYNKYLKPYLKVQKVEETDTFEAKVKVYFTDGSMLLFSYNSWIFYPDAKNYEQGERSDNSLKDRNRADSGIKYFTFHFYPTYGNGGIYPYAQPQNISDSDMRNNSSLGCKAQVVSNERAYCTLMIARNGWTIPDDYPLKF